MVLHQLDQLFALFACQFSELNPLLTNRYRAERAFLFNQIVTDKLKGNVFDVEPVFGDEDIKGAGTVDGTFIRQVGKGQPAETDVLNLAQLVRLLPDGCECAFRRLETLLLPAFSIVDIGQC